ncbi:MAG: acyltransferase family protein [Thermoanaerobaculia bacterium]
MPALDGIRGFGVLAVLAIHFVGVDPAAAGGRGNAGAFLDFLAIALGIPVFFILSGFLITGILLESREKPRYFRNFYGRRALRIFPAYFAVLTVVFVIHPAWGRAIAGSSSPRWLWTYLTNIEIAHRHRWSYGYLSHFWSLAVEEQYYLIWPLIVLAFPPRRLLLVCAALAISSVALRVLLTAGWKNLIGAYVLMPCQLDSFCIGGALAMLVRRVPPPRLRNVARAAILGSLAAYFVLGWYRTRWTSRPQVVGRPVLCGFLFGGLLILAMNESGFVARFLSLRPWTFAGKYSYGLYVYHFTLLPFLAVCFPRAAIGKAVGSRFAGVLASVTLSTIACLLVAIVSYEGFEKRFLRLKARIAS